LDADLSKRNKIEVKKRATIVYWICIGLLLPALGIGSLFDLISQPDNVKVVTLLGYPAYLVPFLGAARLLGLFAIVVPGFPRIKEWAYAGLAFDIILAIYSILSTGHTVLTALIPALVLVVLMGTYVAHHRRMSIQ
jgi:DoxX-like family